MSAELQDLKKGDVIIRFGTVHKIYQVDTVEKEDGEKDRVIHFKPVYKNRRNETLRLSIPLSSIDKTTIRLPSTKTALREELKFLRTGDYQRTPFNRIKVKRIVNSNELHDVARVLKTLWEEKRDEERNFTISKRNTYKMVLHRFQQEATYVLEMTLDEAEDTIITALDTGWSRQQRLHAKEEAEVEKDN